jgi:oligopeptidase A
MKVYLTDKELRLYFPLTQVLEGLFTLAQRIFQVTITSADGQASRWHKDVRYFQVNNELGETIAYFDFDLYSRSLENREGACMKDCIARPGKNQTRQRILYSFTCRLSYL